MHLRGVQLQKLLPTKNLPVPDTAGQPRAAPRTHTGGSAAGQELRLPLRALLGRGVWHPGSLSWFIPEEHTLLVGPGLAGPTLPGSPSRTLFPPPDSGAPEHSDPGFFVLKKTDIL